MKMTDELADQLRNKLRNIISGYKINEDDAGWLEGLMAARLVADQQKGGGEVVLWITPEMLDDLRKQQPWTAGAFTEASQRQRDDYCVPLYITPQPSIPAPAQQDGKASGGEVDDAMVERAARAMSDLNCIAPKFWRSYEGEARVALTAALAKPPHADQETQG